MENTQKKEAERQKVSADLRTPDHEAVMQQGFDDAECGECGYAARVEPDGDYACPECGDGRLRSSLIDEGLI